jgi:hypothetical protein
VTEEDAYLTWLAACRKEHKNGNTSVRFVTPKRLAEFARLVIQPLARELEEANGKIIGLTEYFRKNPPREDNRP